MPGRSGTQQGDAQLEELTRRQYRQWAQHGMQVVQRLAEEHAGPPRWPELDVDRPAVPDGVLTEPHTTHSPPPGPQTVQDAQDNGWLVEVAEHAVEDRLPITVKDNIDVAGMRVRNGTPGATWRMPATSSHAWQQLEHHGAACIGKAALHEMAWGVITPQIANPLDRDRIAGGSSGGSAACVAAGVSAGSLGTDTGGSLRIPAALCGVVGFRPTTGLIDMTGVTALAPEQDTVGPIAHDVRTCARMMEALCGHGLIDIGGADTRLRIGVLAKPGRLDDAVQDAMNNARHGLTQAGVELVDVDDMQFRDAIGVSLTRQLVSSAGLYSHMVHDRPQSFGPEARALLTLGEELTASSGLIARAAQTLTSQTAELFARHRLDVIMTPTTPCIAPAREHTTVDIGGRPEPVAAALPRFTAWASATGMPAISVPVWPHSASRLPAGIQIMAPPHHEHMCIRAAQLIEKLLIENSVGRTTP